MGCLLSPCDSWDELQRPWDQDKWWCGGKDRSIIAVNVAIGFFPEIFFFQTETKFHPELYTLFNHCQDGYWKEKLLFVYPRSRLFPLFENYVTSGCKFHSIPSRQIVKSQNTLTLNDIAVQPRPNFTVHLSSTKKAGGHLPPAWIHAAACVVYFSSKDADRSCHPKCEWDWSFLRWISPAFKAYIYGWHQRQVADTSLMLLSLKWSCSLFTNPD